MKVFSVLVVNCWYCWEILRIVNWLLFFFLSRSRVYFFVNRSCKGIKDGRKKVRLPLDTNFILGVYHYTLMKMFSWTSRNSRTTPNQNVWSILWNHLWQLQVWGSIVCSVGMFGRGCYWYKGQNALLSSGPSKHVRSLQAEERKKIRSSWGD